MRILVLLLVALTACAGQGDDDPVMQSPPPATPESDAPVDGETLTGVLGGDAQLEGGCAWLDVDGTRWEVLYPEGYSVSFDPLTLHGPDGPVAEEGATITAIGTQPDDIMTVCQVGPVFQATAVEVGG